MINKYNQIIIRHSVLILINLFNYFYTVGEQRYSFTRNVHHTVYPSTIMPPKNCIFCDLSKLNILLQDAKYAIFRDIKPATEHHYLVVPKEHLPNPKYLHKDHLPLIEEMKSFALQYVQTNIENFNEDKLRLGFHWAPFNTIAHLHLHVIYPADQMSFLSRTIFRPKSFWFADVDDTIEYLTQVNVV